MKRLLSGIFIALILVLASFEMLFAGWNPRVENVAAGEAVENPDIATTIAEFKENDPDMEVFFENAHGYAVFPKVGKAGIGIGGAYGKGEVFEQGTLIGFTNLKQLSVGFQLGGQQYREIIFFKDKAALDDFTSGNFEFSAQASAVAVKKGISSQTDYDDGVAVFTLARGGLMYEASIGGQKFKFKPLKKAKKEKEEKAVKEKTEVPNDEIGDDTPVMPEETP